MKVTYVLSFALAFAALVSCNEDKKEPVIEVTEIKEEKTFDYNVEQFADIKILRYQIPGWDNLTLKEQKLVYYLTQAGLAGRDIIWDQNYRHNLKIRKALETVYANYSGDKTSEEWKAFETYLKRVWFSNGIHHHYSNDKLKPEFSQEYLKSLMAETNASLEEDAFNVIFNEVDSKK
ncbi:MAG TPA: dihydrofolate reductase, partial [Xanthomarina gelatinilytica]|nr:dihydrofolate reductase [Xanthomarina gelatinilytica]